MRLPSAFRWSLAAALIGIALIVLRVFWYSEDEKLLREMREFRGRPVAGRVCGSSYAAPALFHPSDAMRDVSVRIFTSSKIADDVRARAALWSGHVRTAKELLERVTSSRRHPTAAVWSDYSAALYADAAPDDAFQLAKAIAAADHALELDPNLPEALFNRALALEAMSVRAAAADAYKKYLTVDRLSAWSSEAQWRLEKLESSMQKTAKARKALDRIAESDDELFINDTAITFPNETRELTVRQFLRIWGERVLAKDAHRAASMLRRCRIIGRTLETQFRDSFVADIVRAIDGAADPTELAKANIAYARWTSFEAKGSPLALARRTESILHIAGHALLYRSADTSSPRIAAKRTGETWQKTLVTAAETGDDATLALTLYRAAKDAIAAGHWDVAHGLLNALVTTPHGTELHRDALAWRALTAQRAGMSHTAVADLRAAHQGPRLDDLPLVEALLAKSPVEAATLLREPLNAAERRGDHSVVAQLLLERARLLRAAGQPSRAHHDLERAVALLEQHRISASNMMIRDAVLGTPDTAHRLLADSLDTLGQTEQALNALELSPSSPRVPETLLPRTLLITYGVFNDRLAIFTRSSLGLTRTAVTVKRSRIESLVSQFDQAIARDDQLAFQNTARTLEQALVEPIATQVAAADTLVFVRDPAFGNLPFAALSSGNHHYLIHDHNVVVTSSFSAYLRASHTKTAMSSALLSVGNPLSGERRDGALASLPAAESEAEEIAAMYPSHALLVEGDATKKRVLGALPLCDAAHFAVHANAGLGEMVPPHLVLTGTANDEGMLTAPEIAALHLNGLRTVMLAGCRTALSSQPGDDSLVNSFLTAGAGSVVGTLWEVEDAPTRTMSTMFHRELRKGLSPKDALRATQLEMIKRGAAPSVWASLQLYGSGK
jgi:CHAT domain-containing protein